MADIQKMSTVFLRIYYICRLFLLMWGLVVLGREVGFAFLKLGVSFILE